MASLRKKEQSRDISIPSLMLGRAYAAGIDGVRVDYAEADSGWTLLHRERSHVESGKRLSKDGTKPRLNWLHRLIPRQERARKWSEDHAAKPLAQ